MRYLGIDYGTKKVGIALSDEAGTTGFPHTVLSNDGRLIEVVTELIKERDVEQVIVGESRNQAGEENPVARHARAFAEALEERSGVPVHFELEQHTTQEARQLPGGSRTKKRDVVDAAAAALILTSYLERSSGTMPPEPEVY